MPGSPLSLRNLSVSACLLREGWEPAESLSTTAQDDVVWGAWRDSAPLPDLVDEIRTHPTFGDVLTAELHQQRRPPAWLRLLGATTGMPSTILGGEASGAVLFCPVPDDDGVLRWIAWTFGTGSRWLRRPATEPRFGLMVALNLVARGAVDARDLGLREVAFHQPSPYPQRTASRSARLTPVGGFRLDPRSDLLAVIAGRSGAALLGDVRGGRPIQLHTDVTSPDDLPLLSVDLLAYYHAQDYHAAFAWVDNIVPVSDQLVVAKLRQALADTIRATPNSPNVDVLLPDDFTSRDDERSVSYILLPHEQKRGACRTTLTMPIIEALIIKATADEGLDADLRFLDHAYAPLGPATVLECLTAELELDREHYILHDGDFYRVVPAFIEGIDAAIDRIPISAIVLPPYRGGREDTYNKDAGKAMPSEVVVLDRELIRLPGEAGIEACDLIHKNGALIHVKRKGRSSVFSHLCFQASNSCRVLRSSSEARSQVTDMARTKATDPKLFQAVAATIAGLSKYGAACEVTFAILGDWRDRTVRNLPLFSRISLVETTQAIESMGFQPTIALIDQPS